MECPGPRCAAMILQWLRTQAEESAPAVALNPGPTAQPLFRAAAYVEDAPALNTPRECEGAIEHLEYAVYRRFSNQLTRAERARLDNTIRNALYKLERYLSRQRPDAADSALGSRFEAIQAEVREARERVERQSRQARRAELKLGQLDSLTPEGFEDFVAELFEALGFTVDRVGGTGDEGADLFARRDALRAVVQCKYHRGKAVVGSPELQKFLGTIHHTRSHKGFFVTTRTFTLSAERFAGENPIELIDGPRLVELVHQAMGAPRSREAEPAGLFDAIEEPGLSR